MAVWLMLKAKHPHERDAHLRFDEGPHVYYIDGDRDNVSVTTLVHRYFKKFDSDAIIQKMMASPNWPNSKYFGMSVPEIKRVWSEAGRDASTRGTRMHKSIECFYNQEPVSACEDVEFKMFTEFDSEWNLEPYRTEWEIFDKDLRIAGSVDMVFVKDGEYMIYDWKRSKEIKFDNRWSRGLGVMEGHDDCNHVTYSLQLNIYRYILEKHYGLHISGMWLVVIHPTFDKYQRIQCLNLKDEVELIMNERLEEIKCMTRNIQHK